MKISSAPTSPCKASLFDPLFLSIAAEGNNHSAPNPHPHPLSHQTSSVVEWTTNRVSEVRCTHNIVLSHLYKCVVEYIIHNIIHGWLRPDSWGDEIYSTVRSMPDYFASLYIDQITWARRRCGSQALHTQGNINHVYTVYFRCSWAIDAQSKYSRLKKQRIILRYINTVGREISTRKEYYIHFLENKFRISCKSVNCMERPMTMPQLFTWPYVKIIIIVECL